MSSRRPDPAAMQIILASIRQGAYPEVACEAQGFMPDDFHRWMKVGSRPTKRTKARQFFLEIRKAMATARLAAEWKVFKDDPRFWLRSGPGRETPEEKGWTQQVKPTVVTNDNRSVNLLASPVWGQILAALKDFPGARSALLNAIQSQEALPPPT